MTNQQGRVTSVSALNLREVLRRPLRAVGLDRGRAVANANPSETQRRHDREALRNVIANKRAESGAAVTPITPASTRRFAARRPNGPRHNPYVDAGWWPRTADLASELDELLRAAQAVGFETSRVTYCLDDPWIAPARSVLVRGRQIKVSGYHNHRTRMITLIDGTSHEVLEVMVIPPDSDATMAELALQIAAVHTDPRQGKDILALAGVHHACGA